MNSVSMATNCAPFCRAQNAATASLSVIRLIAEGYTTETGGAETLRTLKLSPQREAHPATERNCGRSAESSGQQLLRLLPEPAHDLAGRFRPRQRGGLPRPRLHPVHIAGFGRRLAHRRRQAALYWVGRGKRRLRDGGGADVI